MRWPRWIPVSAWRKAVSCVWVGLLVSALALPTHAQAQPAGPDPHYQKGVELQKAGKLPEAVAEYEASLKKGSRLEVLANLGAALAGLGRYEEAIIRYNEALKLAPGHPMVLFNLGASYYKSGNLQMAAESFEQACKADPSNVRSQILVGDCRLQLGEYRKAIEILEPLEQKNPQDLTLAYLLGSAYMKDRQLDKGQRQLEKILKNGESAETHLMMAIAMSGVFRNKEAIEAYKKALQLNPKIPLAHVGLATEYLRQSELDLAMSEYKAELEINPNDYTANFYLGYLHRRNRAYEESLGYLNRALKLRPNDGAAMLQLGMAYLLIGKLDEAQKTLEAVVKNEPEFVDGYIHLARVYFKKKMIAEGQAAQKTADELRSRRESARKVTGYDPDGPVVLEEGTDSRP